MNILTTSAIDFFAFSRGPLLMIVKSAAQNLSLYVSIALETVAHQRTMLDLIT